uniref:CD3 gamma/delta subunit Ig-like domain-containing protein n=1 Tax=Amphilophus citrinellus TaxID=61819 RepID=A0A3Q0RTF2_AMPCI
MKSHSALPTCLLLLWTFAVSELAEGVKLTCPDGYWFEKEETGFLELSYRDDNTKEYKCTKNKTDAEGPESVKIFVKFRSKFCRKNCVFKTHNHLNNVFFFMIIHVSSGSDRQHLVSEGRGTNDHYQVS